MAIMADLTFLGDFYSSRWIGGIVVEFLPLPNRNLISLRNIVANDAKNHASIKNVVSALPVHKSKTFLTLRVTCLLDDIV